MSCKYGYYCQRYSIEMVDGARVASMLRSFRSGMSNSMVMESPSSVAYAIYPDIKIP